MGLVASWSLLLLKGWASSNPGPQREEGFGGTSRPLPAARMLPPRTGFPVWGKVWVMRLPPGGLGSFLGSLGLWVQGPLY